MYTGRLSGSTRSDRRIDFFDDEDRTEIDPSKQERLGDDEPEHRDMRREISEAIGFVHAEVLARNERARKFIERMTNESRR
jgi:hypothetical protein